MRTATEKSASEAWSPPPPRARMAFAMRGKRCWCYEERDGVVAVTAGHPGGEDVLLLAGRVNAQGVARGRERARRVVGGGGVGHGVECCSRGSAHCQAQRLLSGQ